MTFVSEATTVQYIPAGSGHTVPILMPPVVAPGDYLYVTMGQMFANAVNTGITPAGWTNYSGNGYHYVKVANGTEAGTTVNFTSSTTPLTGTADRVWLAFAVCYRFPVPPVLIDTVAVRNATSAGSSVSSGSYGGNVADPVLRVFHGFGQGTDDNGDLINTSHPTSGYAWTNVTARDGLISEAWAGGSFLNDGTSMVLGDVEHNYSGAIYDPGDALTFTGGGAGADPSTGVTLYLIRFHFTSLIPLAYWGINATTPA